MISRIISKVIRPKMMASLRPIEVFRRKRGRRTEATIARKMFKRAKEMRKMVLLEIRGESIL